MVVGTGMAPVDLRRTAACFKDLNGRLRELRAWAGNSRRIEAATSGREGGKCELLTMEEVGARTERSERRVCDALWVKAEEEIDARKRERDVLKEALEKNTADKQRVVEDKVTEAAGAEAKAFREARAKRERVEEEVEVLRREVRKKAEEEEEERDAEDERISKENARANKRRRYDESPKKVLVRLAEALQSHKEKVAKAQGNLTALRKEREECDNQMKERAVETSALKEMSKAFETDSSVDDQMVVVKKDREEELKAISSRASSLSKLSAQRDKYLKHLLSFLKEDAPSPEQMLAMEALLVASYGNTPRHTPATFVEGGAAAAAATSLLAKTGLDLRKAKH